ncbi:acetyltransferase [Clostridium combesii]|uniref:Acetyltransferase n=2 Tax=Clostridium combesii TaxID=39481 RepID=A0A2G7HP69_9CLOT|nr:acetyltransferase [Clostridium combesii]
MDGTAGLEKSKNFDEWLSIVIDSSRKEIVMDGIVPSSTYLAIRLVDIKLIGMIDIRHKLNDYLFQNDILQIIFPAYI